MSELDILPKNLTPSIKEEAVAAVVAKLADVAVLANDAVVAKLADVAVFDVKAWDADVAVLANDAVVANEADVANEALVANDAVPAKVPKNAEAVTAPVTFNEPVIGCDPVKYAKLLSNSSIVRADPFCSLKVKFAIGYIWLRRSNNVL